METSVHLVVPGLFPPADFARSAVAGIDLPILESILARAVQQPLHAEPLETWLCSAFGTADGAVAPVTLLADGGQPDGHYWLRADPVHITLQGSEVLLQPVAPSTDAETAQLCDSLNRHFLEEGLHFLAPHPQRWYLRLPSAPAIETYPLSQVAGRDIRPYLPHGQDALRWHRLFNEIQMLLNGHAVNDAREQRGEPGINSIWLWGGGFASERLHAAYDRLLTDSALVAAFGLAAGMPVQVLPEPGNCRWPGEQVLIVRDDLRGALQHGDLGAWRDSLQQLEDLLRPLWRDLRKGRIRRLTLDVPQGEASCRFSLTPAATWRFWRRRRLAQFAV